MESCRTCRFASIVKQQCRKGAPQVFPVVTNRGPIPFTAFPGLPPDDSGCGQHEPAMPEELARREQEHPQTVREVPAPRLVTQ